MEPEPFHVTRSPASASSCRASGTEPRHGRCSASVWMKTKRVRRSTRAVWMAIRRPDSRQESDEVGIKTTALLCSTQSSTESATAANTEQTAGSRDSLCVFLIRLASTHTVPWQDISVAETETVAKSFFQNTLQKASVRFSQPCVGVALVVHHKGVVAFPT